MLRTIFVVAIIIFGATQSFRGPFYGLLFYLWIAYFRPEAWLWWDFVSPLNLSFVVGTFVVISSFVSGDRLRLGVGSTLMLLFLAQSCISTLLSDSFSSSWPFFEEFAKTTVITIMMVMLVNTEQRLRLTLMMIVFSLGAEAAKQGWIELLRHPGAVNVNEHPFLGDNNGVAVGMFMLVPILLALARTTGRGSGKLLYRFLSFGVLYRGIATFSRGGFLAGGALGLHYLVRSKRKASAVVALVVAVLLIAPVLPAVFWNRMSTIDDALEDTSSADRSIRSRLHFWQVALTMANDHPLTGIGHNAFVSQYNKYDFSFGEYGVDRAVHSAWLGVLSELGYPGLLLYIAIIVSGFRVGRRAQRLAKQHAELADLAVYATAIEAALVVFAVGGSFVSFQYNEMFWHMVGLSCATDNLVRARVSALAGSNVAPVAVPVFSGVNPVRAGVITAQRAV